MLDLSTDRVSGRLAELLTLSTARAALAINYRLLKKQFLRYNTRGDCNTRLLDTRRLREVAYEVQQEEPIRDFVLAQLSGPYLELTEFFMRDLKQLVYDTVLWRVCKLGDIKSYWAWDFLFDSASSSILRELPGILAR